MSDEFVVRRVRRRRLKGKSVCDTPDPTPIPNESNNDNVIHVERDSVLPNYLLNPPDTPEGVMLEGNHTKELVYSYRVAKEVLGSSFRPKESNLAVGKIRV